MKYYTENIIDGNSLTLKEYLNILLNGDYKKLYPNNCFPSNDMIEEYLKLIKNASDEEIKKIIFRFIIHEGGYGLNRLHINYLKKNKELAKDINKYHPIYLNRLLHLGKPWEGLTWIIDLLPDHPKDVLKITDSFFKIYCLYLPDNVMFGLSNIDQIVRAKYLNVDHSIEILYDHEFKNEVQ